MANYFGYGQTAPALPDVRVDRLSDVDPGEVDDLPALAIDIPDREIIRNLEDRIQDAQGYWNSPDGFDLYNIRQANTKLYLGQQLDVRSLYRFQTPYVENQIYVAEQAIISYLTAEMPQPEATPSAGTPQAKQYAQDAEKILKSHSEKRNVNLPLLTENSAKNALNGRIGIIYFKFDPNAGKNGEIIPVVLHPEEMIVDKNARQGENPAFIARALKMSVNEACERWPEKKAEINRVAGIKLKDGTSKQRDIILNIREVWLTHYGKDYQPKEAVVYYCGDAVLEKVRNPHWLYANPARNFLDAPFKPFVFLNFDNDGQHIIDQTSAVEQAGRMQEILNKRGRQFMEVVDKANGVLIIDTRVTGIAKSDAQDLTRDPNQTIVIDTPIGDNGQQGIFELPPAQIPNDLYQDKVDIRTNLHALMGTPSDFTGTADPAADPDTLGQSLLKKNQASGRQDLYVRAIERFIRDYYNMLYQLMGVWYDEKHVLQYNGGDGEFDYLTISRDTMDNNIAINVRSGIFDKQRLEAITLQLFEKEGISLLDVFKLLHMPNAQQLYDNWAKQKVDPMALARDTMDDVDEAKAYMAYDDIMNNRTPTPVDDCTKEFVLTLRKITIRDDFLKSKKAKQKTAFLKYYDEALKSLELRTSLDIMSKEGLQELEPQVPIQPLPPPVMPGQPPMGQPGMPPSAIPGQMPPPQPGAMPQGLPMAQPQMPQGAPPVTNGTPLMNPANPVVPPQTNPAQLPPTM